MTKRHAKVKVVSEREYRDKLNGIRRDKDGKITHIQGKSVDQKEEEIYKSNSVYGDYEP